MFFCKISDNSYFDKSINIAFFQTTEGENVLALAWSQERHVSVTIKWDDKANFTAEKTLPYSTSVSVQFI